MSKASHIEPPHKKKKTGIFRLQDEHHTIMDGAGEQRNTVESPTDDDEIVVIPTPAIRKRGPGPSKPPPVSIGIKGGGFGETVSPALQAVPNGIRTIGLLLVQEDYWKIRQSGQSLVEQRRSVVRWRAFGVNEHISDSLDLVDARISSIRSKTRHFLTNLNILEDVHNILEDISHLQDSFSVGKRSQSLTESAVNAGGEDRIDMNNVTEPEAGPST
ncbi:hypothetical protein IW261DRAFT_1427980 [Armillaria novae-zelandiae]|uniref:Uncharacterized protein n=1 Tax=Armillaria novae-zelandiae TaxID=153914 RepID=A0AA39NBX8_9AGAR|nr:hypothetical protein IW261DRAFT_1427980 [Armillaria novae-zelandiae]